MKNIIVTVLGGCLFWVASVSFACSGCHDPSMQPKTPEADTFQSTLIVPHPISTPSLQINKELTSLKSKQKQ